MRIMGPVTSTTVQNKNLLNQEPVYEEIVRKRIS